MPTANWNIVHTDVRSDPYDWSICNVLSYWDEERKSYELALIDFESLIACGSAQNERQTYAISVRHMGYRGNPHLFVSWQVLWMAYGWWETSDKIEAPLFVLNFFNRDW
jgi:hypothetical protein